jgi:hypothetical protein
LNHQSFTLEPHRVDLTQGTQRFFSQLQGLLALGHRDVVLARDLLAIANSGLAVGHGLFTYVHRAFMLALVARSAFST